MSNSLSAGVHAAGGSEGGRRASSLLTFGILRLGDAVRRWLRHPEPSSWSYKSTIKKKLLYDSSLSEFFSLVRKERKGQKEESFPLLIFFRRLAATSANTLPRPSNYSLTTATGSKRSSADSDSLLCHVRLWRTSRFKFGCASVCEHSKIRVCFGNPVSAQTKFTPALHFQWACRRCVHESARLFRVICSHAWYSLDCGERETNDLHH